MPETKDLVEYHCCVGLENEDDDNYLSLLSFIQSETICVYTNVGFEYTPVKGHHIHICILFLDNYGEYWYKKLTKLRKSLNYIKKCPKHPDALGWYWKPASTKSNLAYILKPETKTRENIAWYNSWIDDTDPAIREKIDYYINLSMTEVEAHQRNKNCHYQQIKKYLTDNKVDMSDKRSVCTHILKCYREVLDKLLPTRIQYEQLFYTLQYDLNPSEITQIADHYNLFVM